MRLQVAPMVSVLSPPEQLTDRQAIASVPGAPSRRLQVASCAHSELAAAIRASRQRNSQQPNDETAAYGWTGRCIALFLSVGNE
jgi:hypothetical protein